MVKASKETKTEAPKPDDCGADYDTIVVGGGPAGLTLATYLPGRVLLLERDATLGGIHKVRRDVDGYFGEHGPRMYSGSFVNFKRVLQDIGLTWDQVFVSAQYSPSHLDGKSYMQRLSVKELGVMAYHLLRLMFNQDHGKDRSVLQVCRDNGFSQASTHYLDCVCRYTDGADISRYSLHKLLHAVADQMGRGFYTPRQANDKLLFPHWQRFLEARGVQIKLAANVTELLKGCGGRVKGVRVRVGGKMEEYTGRRVILATPPTFILGLLQASGLEEPGLRCFTEATEYDSYFCVTYHFPLSTRSPLVDHVGFRDTPWGLVYIEMSRESTAMLSVCASVLTARSPHTGKTANESTRAEAVDEILRQLPIGDDIKKTLIRAVPSSCLQKTKDGWVNIDKAYIYNSAYPRGLPFKLACLKGVYNVGVQNLQSWYAITSIEAAISNVFHFLGRKEERPTTYVTLFRTLLLAILGVAVLIVAWRRGWLRRLRRR